MLTDDNKAAYQQSPFSGPLLQPQRGENDDHFNPVLNLVFCSCFHGMVSCVFFLFTSHGLRRYEASATLQRVFIRTGPAYVCVSCSSPYLRPGGDADLWRRAVCCVVIDDAESIEVFKTLGVRKCAVREGEDANGTVLGWCLRCYSACRPPARKRPGAQCHSLLHPLVKTDAAASSMPGPAFLLTYRSQKNVGCKHVFLRLTAKMSAPHARRRPSCAVVRCGTHQRACLPRWAGCLFHPR